MLEGDALLAIGIWDFQAVPMTQQKGFSADLRRIPRDASDMRTLHHQDQIRRSQH
ncbi:hypothetical protein D3C71_2177310 [compost metagenome]